MNQSSRNGLQVEIENSILVVDDDPDILFGTTRLLKKAGYRVIKAENGEQALNLAQENLPDLILLDYELPDINGLEVLRSLKANKNTSHIYICIVSGVKISSTNQSVGLDIGADDYLTRPIANRELLSRIKAMLRVQKAEQELMRHRDNLNDLVEKRTLELQRSESLLNATQRISKVGGWEWNVESQTMFWTNELYRIHDFHQDEFTAGSMEHLDKGIECYEHEDRIVIQEAFKNCIENGEAYDLEFPFHTTKCQRKWIRTIAEPIRENGTVIKVIGNIIDITAHKQAEEELRKSEGRLRKAEEMAQVGHYVFDMSKDSWTSSSQLNDIFGIDKNYKKTTANWLQIIHPDHREILSDYLQHNILTEHQLFDFEYKVISQRTGHEKWVHGLGELKLDKNSNPIEMFGTIQDITERKKLEKELIKFKKLEATATLAGGIAHDFNNLLAVIIGYIDLTLDDLGMDHKNAGDLNEALNASKKAQQLTQKFITFSSAGTLVKRKLSIKELITESVDVVLSGADYPTELSLEENLWQVEVHAGQMSQVFNNVFVNAKESTEDGGAIQIYAENISSLIDESIVDETLTDSQYVKIVISDQGKGIPDRIMQNIFDPYFSTKERGAQKGMGLGLTVAFSIVKQHDGHLVLKSKENVGTSVFIYLPATV